MLHIFCKSKSFIIGLGLACMLSLTGQAFAAYMGDVTYTYVDNGSGNFTFEFTVANTSTGTSTGPLDFIDIFFDASDVLDYSNVTVLGDNGWQAETFNNDNPSIGDLPGASFDAFQAMVPGIAQGASLGGFQVSFDYSGALEPTEQNFFWLADFGTNTDGFGDQISFNPDPEVWVLATVEGTTRNINNNPVPEPSTMILLGTGLAGMIAWRRKKTTAYRQHSFSQNP